MSLNSDAFVFMSTLVSVGPVMKSFEPACGAYDAEQAGCVPNKAYPEDFWNR